MLDKTLASTLEQDMRDMMKQNGLGENGIVCGVFAERGEEVGSLMKFETAAAASYRALIAR